ncbi:hypothetical protein T440DRAFT_552532 [Plenodomus tracheiphilus IPT5]|uniref:Mtf2-like C-terminal domain-containing protein n=1 Tax=Plenodomus tracheiphilus IPT5 TaxID=1408161 RepID=A0A6A7BHQ2_9PLEO|nr:hypothetical protein T440DRAFT_552532 [Plenodomus tracheiphilus IPT5]
MSVCANTLRAWARSRVPASVTLLPFLYQTATIQQCTTATRPSTRRNFQSRSDGGGDIPFEDDTLPATPEQEPVRLTTITDAERKAFRKLYLTAARQEKEKSTGRHAFERDEIADEYYEEDEEPAVSLDKVFDDVLKGKPALEARAGTRRTPPNRTKRPSIDAQTTDKDTSKSQSTSSTKKAALELKQLRTAELERFTHLLSTAKTDLELWHILEAQVFHPVRLLDLEDTLTPKTHQKALTSRLKNPRSKQDQKPKDNTATTTTAATTHLEETDQTNKRILFQNFPHYLIHAITTLRSSFPTSTLPLSLLPTLKQLGRSAYALGATTTLYKHLLRTAWLQHASYHAIDALLTEMHNSAVEFDAEILALLDSIIKEHNMARSGVFGREMLMVYGLEMFDEGARKVKMWREVVAGRLGPVGVVGKTTTMTQGLGGGGEGMDKYRGPRYVRMGDRGQGEEREKPEWRSVTLT